MAIKEDGTYYSRNKEKCLAAHKEWKAENRHNVLAGAKRYRTENREKRSAYNNLPSTKERVAIYRKTVLKEHIKKYIREYTRNRRRESIEFRILANCRSRVNKAVKRISRSEETRILVGCSTEQLRAHLESKFSEGMTWKNYGKLGWHMDHIKPCDAFDLTKEEDRRACFNYMNLQPLWATDNHKKYNKYND